MPLIEPRAAYIAPRQSAQQRGCRSIAAGRVSRNYHIVAEPFTLRETRPPSRRSGHATHIGVLDLDPGQTHLARTATQIDFQQGRHVCRVKAGPFLERGELVLDYEGQQTHPAELVRRCDHYQSTRSSNPNEVAEDRPRVLKVLDGLDAHDHISWAWNRRPCEAV